MKRIIQWSIERPAVANLLMVFLLVIGGYSAWTMQREMFPEFSLDRVQVSVVYKGASPDEIEESIVAKIEEEISGLEGIKKVSSRSVEGLGQVIAELEPDSNVSKIREDIKNAVDQIDTFPDESEVPLTVEMTRKRPVIKVAISGEVPEEVLTGLAEKVKNDFLSMPDISQVELFGNREYEIWVEISENTLKKYGLTLSQVADLIKKSSFDLPAGTIQADTGKVLLRAKGQRYNAKEFEDIVVLSKVDGTVVRLNEIAVIKDTFEDVDIQARVDGKRAVIVKVEKTSQQDAVDIADKVKAYVKEQNSVLPPSINMTVWDDDSLLIKSRLSLLTRNALQGLAVVAIILALFLRLRLAFWVAMGIPISIMGSFFFLGLYGATLNMISMFSFIVVLGIVVDDAIVVGENVFQKFDEGEPPAKAVVNGTVEMAYPVINAVATTIVAFAPMLFVAGVMGKMFKIFPLAIIAVLTVSLVEVFVILPAHLAHMKTREASSHPWNPLVFMEKIRLAVNAALTRFIETRFVPVMDLFMTHRYVFVSGVVAVLIICFGFVAGGRISFVLFPKIDSDRLTARFILAEGTNVKITNDAVKRLEESARVMAEKFPRKDGRSVIENIFSIVGEQFLGQERGSHVGEVSVQLIGSEERGVPSSKMIAMWRDLAGEIPDAIAMTYTTSIGAGPPGGRPIEIRLLGTDMPRLLAASDGLKRELATFNGVLDIQDSYRPGKDEFRLSLEDGARQLGITLSDLARQVRAGFWGEEPLKVQRGRNEVTIRVRYPESERLATGDLENLKLRTADNKEIPFRQVAKVKEDRGPAIINRFYGRRAVTVTADVDEDTANARDIITKLSEGFFDKLKQDFPGVDILLEGQQKETMESMSSLFQGFFVALFLIYILLVNMFRTYTHPIIVMTAIPFSFIGILFGHVLFGMDFTILSMLGVVALAGIVVNDSLLLIQATNNEIKAGKSHHDALIAGARKRFRQIILTSLSTIGGLTPILLETSFQAQFLKPMTITVVFGLAVSTVLILLFIPALALIRVDLLSKLGLSVDAA
jgi:hydrophobic/amphiphilic exporter-1 (mainly G- bacteria), HAE1 family